MILAQKMENFNGQMDDVRVYNYALTKQQIQQVYNQGAAKREITRTKMKGVEF